jgi:hypothetical protein
MLGNKDESNVVEVQFMAVPRAIPYCLVHLSHLLTQPVGILFSMCAIQKKEEAF